MTKANKKDDYPFTSMATTIAITELASLFTTNQIAYAVQPTSSITLSDMREHPVVLMGAYNNEWTERLQSDLRYRFAADPAREILDEMNPSKIWIRPASLPLQEEDDFAGEAALAADQARAKLKAKPVTPGKYDLVIDPTNLWLTIHESIGHSTELDRALGWEADYTGTSFLTPDKLGKFQFGSPLVNIVGDRSQEGGLATVGYDDDGVRSVGAEFPIIKNGVFESYQMAVGQAALIGRAQSNGCAYGDSPTSFPIQRMPNVSLQPNPDPTSLDDLFADVKDGIYIVGNGSWSIDQQRYNFQFTGQLFYEIKNGKRGEMLRDVAYQGRTPDFWNALDGLGDKSTYFLGGTIFCGKGQPSQSAPVSHGAVPARFRRINVLNTERDDV